MGILDKILLKSKKSQLPYCEPLTVFAPVSGEVIPLHDFPDLVFGEGVLGPGCGILPSEMRIVAPFNSTVIQVPDTKHAVGLRSEDGIELLIHVGVNTVEMNGEGFSSHLKEGQKVRLGEELISFDREAIRSAGYSDAIAVVVTNINTFAGIEILADGLVTAGSSLFKIRKKN